ncbi:serine/threonine-protein phosphatase 4 regulatory subunit 3-like [Olea europaea var. sylvestris]|uniref:serine/threonine-protein phosphatase 4 regulatory subunit 3-like n=1 Tax=Olea europaea var. sylvestris TaxID=158386 RepID=UPI000C1CE625|nr:serine/threonine-protein phosphatase 4 regulatory subunit 3-like [Olea europaea var. sylvestris]
MEASLMGTQDKSPNANNSMQRVKVYRLNEDGRWDDQGTGHVNVDYLERSEDLGLFVIDEEDNETLLLHRISSQDIYRKQEDTIISWRDPKFSTELALSFQEMTGCSYIWDHICTVQRNIQFSSLSNETYHNVNNGLRELPPVELSTLPLILKTVVESGIADQLRVNELILHDRDFFRKLVDLFRICDDLENIDGLHLIFKLVRGIISLNSPQIFEKIFGDELIMDIIGCLEYDPEAAYVHHRSFLNEHVVFKEAIPIKDPLILSKIHQTYRIGYLKDVILPRALDEATVASLNSIVHSNNATVVSLLKDDSTFIQELFATLKSPTTTSESKKTLVHFLHEFCTLSKSLQMVQQLRLFRDLVSEGIFDIIADVLQSEDKKLVLTGTEILILFLNQDPSILRSYVTRQEGVLFGLLVSNTGFYIIFYACEERDTIVEIFYEKHFGQLIDAITSSCASNDSAQTGSKFVSSDGGTGDQSGVKPEILLNICDLLCFCVLQHPYRIKCNFLLDDVIGKVLYLTRRPEKYLVVAAVRFVRTLISRSDEHLMDHIVKNNLFKPIVDAFVGNGDRYNLLNSAILELFEHIRKENLKLLLRYVVDSFWDQLVKLENLPSIQALKVKYEQSLETDGARSNASLLDQRKRTDERALEKEEEDYFNDSDEENSASVATSNRVQSQPVLANGPSGLVDYEDDEDDEDYKPPPKKLSDISEEDEGLAEFRLKRKLVTEEEPEPKRLMQSPKGTKPREGVLAALCSTLTQAVIPSKKSKTGAGIDGPQLDANSNNIERNCNVKGSIRLADDNRNTDVETHAKDEAASPRSFSDSLHDYPDNRQRVDDCALLSPKSSPEMAVNGS